MPGLCSRTIPQTHSGRLRKMETNWPPLPRSRSSHQRTNRSSDQKRLRCKQLTLSSNNRSQVLLMFGNQPIIPDRMQVLSTSWTREARADFLPKRTLDFADPRCRPSCNVSRSKSLATAKCEMGIGSPSQRDDSGNLALGT